MTRDFQVVSITNFDLDVNVLHIQEALLIIFLDTSLLHHSNQNKTKINQNQKENRDQAQ